VSLLPHTPGSRLLNGTMLGRLAARSSVLFVNVATNDFFTRILID
jgi:hypothetical protein